MIPTLSPKPLLRRAPGSHSGWWIARSTQSGTGSSPTPNRGLHAVTCMAPEGRSNQHSCLPQATPYSRRAVNSVQDVLAEEQLDFGPVCLISKL